MLLRIEQHAATFPVTHSVLAAPALVRRVLADYELPGSPQVKLISRSLTDTYLLPACAGADEGAAGRLAATCRRAATTWRGTAPAAPSRARANR
jgi:hypothetical protein